MGNVSNNIKSKDQVFPLKNKIQCNKTIKNNSPGQIRTAVSASKGLNELSSLNKLGNLTATPRGYNVYIGLEKYWMFIFKFSDFVAKHFYINNQKTLNMRYILSLVMVVLFILLLGCSREEELSSEPIITSNVVIQSRPPIEEEIQQ